MGVKHFFRFLGEVYAKFGKFDQNRIFRGWSRLFQVILWGYIVFAQHLGRPGLCDRRQQDWGTPPLMFLASSLTTKCSLFRIYLAQTTVVNNLFTYSIRIWVSLFTIRASSMLVSKANISTYQQDLAILESLLLIEQVELLFEGPR